MADGDACVPEECSPQEWEQVQADFVVASEGGTHDSLADALADAAAGQVIAIDIGQWDAPGVLDRSVTLVGRCQDAVLLAEDGQPALAVDHAEVQVVARRLALSGGAGVVVAAGGVALEDVHVSESSGPAVWVRDAGRVELAEVSLSRSYGKGALVEGAGSSLTATGLTVSETFAINGQDNQQTTSVHVADDAEATLRDLDLSGARLANIAVDGATAIVEGAWLHENATDGEQNHGEAILVRRGGDLQAADLVIESVWQAGIFVTGEGSTAVVSDATITGTRAPNMWNETGGQGTGIWAEGGASVRAERVSVAETAGYGFAADGGALELVDCEVSGATKSVQTSGVGEAGLWVGWGSTVTAERMRIVDGVETGALVGGHPDYYSVGDRARLTLVDSEISGHTDEDGYNGFGIEVRSGGELTLEGTRIHDNFGPGIVVLYGASTTVDIRDSEIDGNRNGGILAYDGSWTISSTTISGQTFDEQWGGATGVLAWDADMSLVDVDIVDNEGIGLIVYGLTTQVTVEGGSIARTQLYADPLATYQLGWGLVADYGATASLDGVTLADNHGIGALVQRGGSIELVDSVVSSTVHSPEFTVAAGLLANDGTITASNTRLEDHEGPGLVVMSGESTCTDCEISGNGYAGAVVSQGDLAIRGGSIHGNVVDASEGGSVGVFVDKYASARAEVDGVEIYDHAYASVWTIGGTTLISDSDLEGGWGVWASDSLFLHGNGIFGLDTGAWDGERGLWVTDSTIHDAAGAGVLLDGGSATLSGVGFQDNAIDLVQQGCDETTEAPEGAPDGATLCPATSQPIDGLYFTLFLDEIEVESW